jgi:hypothetical protein
MLKAALNNPSGGIRYHWRAFRNRERRWGTFRDQLEQWLSGWQPSASTLAIVGPSGGYCLPLGALARFSRFVIFEPDPVARWVLKRRLQQSLPDRSVTWIAEDAWVAPLNRGGSIPGALLGKQCALLFSNIIGQLPYMVPDVDYPTWRDAWCKSLWPVLERTSWASFHDRVSGAAAPPDELPNTGQRLSDAEVQDLYRRGDPSQVIELIDHGSQELLPLGRDYRYFHWPLMPGAHHLIEGVIGGPDR